MHTEGPWKEDDKHTSGARAIIGDGQQLVALIYGKTLEEQEANARLICDVLPPSPALEDAKAAGGDCMSGFCFT